MKYVFTIVVVIFVNGYSGELKYEPINSSFGGNGYATQIWLSNAQAQNDYKDPSVKKKKEKSNLEKFKENLNRQLLSKISHKILQNGMNDGEESMTGVFKVEDFQVSVQEANGELNVEIYDISTGESTTLRIPILSK